METKVAAANMMVSFELPTPKGSRKGTERERQVQATAKDLSANRGAGVKVHGERVGEEVKGARQSRVKGKCTMPTHCFEMS